MGSLLFVLLQLAGLTQVSRTNALTRQANEAFARGDFKTAARAYGDMVTKYDVDDEAVMTNLAHSYFRVGDMVNATRYYNFLANSSKDATLKSMANSQLGVISASQKNLVEARDRFKESLRLDPNNSLARINYERLMRSTPKLREPDRKPLSEEEKKKQEEKKKEEQKQKQEQEKQQGGSNAKPGQDNKPQQSQDREKEKQQQQGQKGQNKQPKNQPGQEDKETKGRKSKQGQHDPDEKEPEAKPGDQKDESKPEEDENGKEGTREQLKRMQISEEKSKQILDAMRASEVQYLQQKRFRRQEKNRGKNDW